ncbi:MAG TPA: tetratricopeptide repeat protein [Gemmatimonadota bacterium]|nr:tetratricopeptide repeat protein [Gemmatimonadota bacterium]
MECPHESPGREFLTMTAPDRIELRTLGHIALRAPGSDADDVAQQPKRFAILVFLVVAEPRGFHRRDSLLALFWPELPEKRARNALNKTLHFLRSRLGSDVILSRGGTEVGIEPGAIWCDAVAFEEALRDGNTLDALELYGGPFLEGFHVSETPEFDHWIERQRDHLEISFAGALQELATRSMTRGDREAAVDLWRRLVDHDLSNSRAVLGLMEALESVGERAAALQLAEQHGAHLREEFEAEPDVEVETFANRLRQEPKLAAPLYREVPENLPWQPGPLVGREHEIAMLSRMIEDPAARLITLTGPGGAGKTSLAIHVARAMLARYPEGVFFVNLGILRDAGLVGVTIARTIGIEVEAGANVGEKLRAGLDRRRCLLVLDGFEAVLPAAERISDLLEETEEVEILVTSRAVLQLRGERIFPVPPLRVPDPETQAGVADLLRYGAVDLFVQRARAADPEFRLNDENRIAVAGICAGLDGLPLAIELAAARVRLLEPSMILSRLGQRFDLLRGGPRDLPERQQTLRRTFDWSYDLLSDRERRLFRHLCVFVGGCSLPAIRSVCYGEDEPEAVVLDELEALVDNSLLRHVDSMDENPRFEMLDTIREYGRRLLEDGDELAVLQRGHATYFLELAERAEQNLAGKGQAEWLDRLEPEFANVQAVLDWALEWEEIELAVRLGSALWWFIWLRGHFTEMRLRLDQALARRSLLPAYLQANLMIARGAIASMDGEHERAMGMYQEALDVERERLDERQVTQVLRGMAFALSGQGEYAKAIELLEESLTLSRRLESASEITAALRGLGKMALHLRDYDRAEALYEEAQDLGRRRGDRNAVAWALHGLGEVARHRGDYDRAADLLEQGIRICRELESKPGIAYLRLASAHVARYQGDLPEARRRYEEALRLLHELGNRRRLGICLMGLAALDAREGNLPRALVLIGAADPISEAGEIRLAPIDQAEYDRAVVEIRSLVAECEIERLRQAGREMELGSVVDLALSHDHDPPG